MEASGTPPASDRSDDPLVAVRSTLDDIDRVPLGERAEVLAALHATLAAELDAVEGS